MDHEILSKSVGERSAPIRKTSKNWTELVSPGHQVRESTTTKMRRIKENWLRRVHQIIDYEILSKSVGEKARKSGTELVAPRQVHQEPNMLYTHLRSSVAQSSITVEPDPIVQRYHEALLTTPGAYSSSPPNFQKIEIMMFILSKSPSKVNYESLDPQSVDSEQQHMVLKALLTVADKFTPVQFPNMFPLTFLDPLLDKLNSPDPKKIEPIRSSEPREIQL